MRILGVFLLSQKEIDSFIFTDTTLKGLIFAGINFHGSYFCRTYIRDFAKNRENKFRENLQSRES